MIRILLGSLPFVVLASLATACGSSSVQSASVSGTFAGESVVATDSAAFSSVNGTSAMFSEIIASTAGVCSGARRQAAQANGTRLELLVQTNGLAGQASIAPGTYAITHGDPAVDTKGNFLTVAASYNAFDGKCLPTIAETTSLASSGTITIASVMGATSAGTFDLTFPSGDHLSGSFDSPICADPSLLATPTAEATFMSSSNGGSCQP